MRQIIIVLCVVVGSLAICSGGDTEYSDEPDVQGQHHRIVTLQEDLATFRAKLSNRRSHDKNVNERIDQLSTRLRFLEGSGCDDVNELQCGGDSPICLSRLLICDTYDDCPNGFDESECDVYTPAGSIWEGNMIYDKCNTRTNPEKIKLTIENYRIIDYLRSYPEVTATIETDSRERPGEYHHSESLTGWMDLKPGIHLLYFHSAVDGGLDLGCVLDGKNNDHCHGYLVHKSTREKCAEFYIKRIDRHH